MKRIAMGSWAYAIGPYEKDPIDFDTVCTRVKELGFDGVELAAFAPHPNPHDMPDKSQRDHFFFPFAFLPFLVVSVFFLVFFLSRPGFFAFLPDLISVPFFFFCFFFLRCFFLAAFFLSFFFLPLTLFAFLAGFAEFFFLAP